MEASVTKVEPAIDWLTATWSRENAGSARHIENIVTFERTLLQNGHEQETSQWQGYFGRKTGSFFVGERTDGYCLRVSGSLAHPAFTSIYRPDMHVSRLDIAVTAWLEPHTPNLGLQALSTARIAKLGGKVKNPATITHYESDDGGFTLYIGKRSSRVYSRLYNKEVESGDMYYDGAWRYECELHNATATETAVELHYTLFPLEEAISSAVWKYYHEKGVKPVFDPFDNRVEIVLPRREETTIERSLKWLEQQVRPTVARLSTLGYTSSVLGALGLPGADRGHD
jgi:DNA relaxase NicK